MADLSGGSELNDLNSRDPKLVQVFKRVINYVNNMSADLVAAGFGKQDPPPPIGSLSIATGGELVQPVISHPGSIRKGIQYFTEVGVNDPTFAQPLVEHHGTSRSPTPFHLPALDSNGTPIQYYFRSGAQYPGSDPTRFVYHGSKLAPVPITLTGTTKMAFLPSTGSGTASNTGQQGGQGMGKTMVRTPAGPKRNLGSS